VCVCVSEREREYHPPTHPPRLGGGEDRQRARPSNRERGKESGNERQT